MLKNFNIYIIVEPEPDTLLQVSIRHCIMLPYNSLRKHKMNDLKATNVLKNFI